MSHSFGDPPFFWFTPPGIISVTSAAMARARQFLEEIERTQPRGDRIIGFSWGDERHYRDVLADAPWKDLGPGIDIVAYERQDVPPQAIHVIDGMEVLIAVPKPVWARSTMKLIDLDAGNGVILR